MLSLTINNIFSLDLLKPASELYVKDRASFVHPIEGAKQFNAAVQWCITYTDNVLLNRHIFSNDKIPEMSFFFYQNI